LLETTGGRDATWVGLLMNQAIACTNLSRVKEARSLFEQTEFHCKRLGLDGLGAGARYNRAFLEALMGDYRNALTMLEEAGEVFGRQGSRDMLAASQRSRAEMYLDLGMPGEAHDLAMRAAAVFAAEGMDLDAALCSAAQARSLLDADRPADAKAILWPTLDFFTKRGLRPRRAEILLQLSRAERMLGDLALAASLARRAEGIFRRLGLGHGIAESGRLLAEALLAQGRLVKAEAALKACVPALRGLPIIERLGFWHVAGRVSLARGKKREAARRLGRAARLIEAQRRLIPGTEFRAQAFEAQVQVYLDLITMALEAPRPRFEALFTLVETARARGFRERMSAGRSAWGMRITERRALLGSLTRRLEEAELTGKGGQEMSAVGDLRRRTRAVETEVLDLFRRAGTRELGLPRWAGAPRPAAVAAQLVADEALVEYFVAGEQVLVLILRRDGQRLLVLPSSASAIRRHLDQVQFQLTSAAMLAQRGGGNLTFLRGTVNTALEKLGQSTFGPLEPLLRDATRLILIPHSFLHRVPFECLRSGSGYLGERLSIARSPTADFVLRRPKSGPRKRKVLVCGAIEGGPAFAAHEIDAVAARFAPGVRRVLRDPTSREIMAQLPSSRIVHLSTHGVFREDNPLFSRLATADGALFVADIVGVELAAELVVLSACEAGLASAGRADDLSGVAHAFLAAGTRRLVAGQWRVHDAATQTLMASFYDHYLGAARRDPVRALRGAQAELRREWDHPFYWGGFCVFGA
jgi:CHAT domain-containing protein/tetratricopeptide (TPR) repeat protein